MAENPFNPKNLGLLAELCTEPRRNSLLDYVTPPPALPQHALGILGAVADLFPPPTQPLPTSAYPYSGAIADLFGPPKAPHTNSLTGAVADLFPTSPSPPFGFLASLTASPPPSFPAPSPAPLPFNALYTPSPKPKLVTPETKRRVFFSFHFDDIMRVNNVRNTWKISHPDSSANRSFYDSSLWEARKLTSPDGIKKLIRLGVLSTSAVCVLAGSMTWDRRWVRYEIARAIIDGRGLLTVHLNSINHHRTKGPDPVGLNPLAHMGVAKLQPNALLPPQYYLYEMTLVPNGYGGVIEKWSRYGDYSLSMKKPAWVSDPDVDHVMPLSVDAAEYDYELGSRFN